MATDRVLIATTNDIAGYEAVEYKGLVWGITVRAKHAGHDIGAGCKQIFGGELAGYTAMAEEARQEALDRMIKNARRLGANAVLRVAFDAGGGGQGTATMTAYGTAVVIRPV